MSSSRIEIVTPPVSKNLTTLEAAQSELHLTGQQELQRLEWLIKQASGLVASYCNQPLVRTRYKEIWRRYHYPGFGGWDAPGFGLYLGNRRRPLLLSRMPVVSLFAATVDGIALEVEDIMVEGSGRIHGVWGGGVIAITYDAGYIAADQENTDIPPEIERACLDTISALWYRSKRGDPTLKRDRVDGIGDTEYYDPTVTGNGSVPPSAMQALSNYRRINV